MAHNNKHDVNENSDIDILKIIKACESIAFGSFDNGFSRITSPTTRVKRPQPIHCFNAISNGPGNDVKGNWRRRCPQLLTHVKTASSFITHTKFYLTSE
jgi:hypothetical protein